MKYYRALVKYMDDKNYSCMDAVGYKRMKDFRRDLYGNGFKVKLIVLIKNESEMLKETIERGSYLFK